MRNRKLIRLALIVSLAAMAGSQAASTQLREDGVPTGVRLIDEYRVPSDALRPGVHLLIGPSGKDLLIERRAIDSLSRGQSIAQKTKIQRVLSLDDAGRPIIVDSPGPDGVWRANGRIVSSQSATNNDRPSTGTTVYFEDDLGNKVGERRTLVGFLTNPAGVRVGLPGIAKLFLVRDGERIEIGQNIGSFSFDPLGNRVLFPRYEECVVVNVDDSTREGIPIPSMRGTEHYVSHLRCQLLPGRRAVVVKEVFEPRNYKSDDDTPYDSDEPEAQLFIADFAGRTAVTIPLAPEGVKIHPEPFEIVCSKELLAFCIDTDSSKFVRTYALEDK